MNDVDKNMLYQQTAGIPPVSIPPVLGLMRDYTAKIQGQMTANQKALLAATPYSDEENGKAFLP